MKGLVICTALLLLSSCGGGSEPQSTSQSAPPPTNTKKIQTDQNRIITAGDKITYETKYSYEQYGWSGEVISSNSYSTKLNLEYFSAQKNILSQSYNVLAQQQYLGNSGADTNYFIQKDTGELLELGNLTKELIGTDDGASISLGITLFPPKYLQNIGLEKSFKYVSGAESTKKGGIEIAKSGVRSIRYNAAETIDTPLGKIDAYKITLTDDWKEVGLSSTESGKTVNIYYIHPALGIIKFSTTDEDNFSNIRKSKTTLTGIIESTNVLF